MWSKMTLSVVWNTLNEKEKQRQKCDQAWIKQDLTLKRQKEESWLISCYINIMLIDSIIQDTRPEASPVQPDK